MLKYSRPIKRLLLSDVAPHREGGDREIARGKEFVLTLSPQNAMLGNTPISLAWCIFLQHGNVGLLLQRVYENLLVEQVLQYIHDHCFHPQVDLSIPDDLLEPVPAPFVPVDFVTLGPTSEGWLFSRASGGHGFITNEPFAFTVLPRADGERTPINGCRFNRGVLVKGWENVCWGGDNIVNGPFLRL